MLILRYSLVISVIAAVSSPVTAGAASFELLGSLSGGNSSNAYAVSADGLIVVGASESAVGRQAFLWTTTQGMVGLGTFSGGNYPSHATGVANAGLVVGYGSSGRFPVATTWTAATGMVESNTGLFGYLYGISADGSTIVGPTWVGPTVEAARYTATDGLVPLGQLPGNPISGGSDANATSADGSVIVGYGYVAPSVTHAFRWTAAAGMVDLGDLPGGLESSLAYSVSADGSTVVGQANTDFDTQSEAFRWTTGSGMQGLGFLPGSAFTVANGVSGDGSVIVGASYTKPYQEAQAFIWTAGTGMQLLSDVLVSQGADNLAGWTLVAADAISADGRVVVGTAFPIGSRIGQAFVARIDPVPTPSAVWLFSSSLAVVTCLSRRSRSVRNRREK
jgi:probable HAF family extracellular repeat protein